jgi:RNA polymerase sigma factor (sigma-70 family)
LVGHCQETATFHWQKNPGGLCAWIGKIVHDKGVDCLRQRSRQQRCSVIDFCALSHGLCAPAPDLESQWQTEVLQTAVKDLRPQIGEVNFRILQLHYWQEKTVPEVGAFVGLSTDQVSCRLQRLLKKLRVRLRPVLQTA